MSTQITSLEKLRPGHYVHAARAGELIFCSGLPGNAEGGLLVRSPDALPPDGRRAVSEVVSTVREERIAAQAWRSLENLRRLLEGQGTSLSRLALLRAYTPVPDRFGVVERLLRHMLGDERPPLSCIPVVEVGRNREVEVALYPIAATPQASDFSRLDPLPATDLQADIGAQGAVACVADGLVWVPLLTPRPLHEKLLGDTLQPSGQEVAALVDPASAHVARVTGQTGQLLAALADLLGRCGAELSRLVQLTLYLRDLRDWPIVVRAVEEQLTGASPAYAFRQLPAGGTNRPSALVELEAVAAAAGVELHRWPMARTADPGASACQAGQLLFTGSLAPLETELGTPIVGYGDSPEAYRRFATGVDHDDECEGPVVAQTWTIFERLRDLLAERGAGMEHVVNLTYALADMRDFPAFNRVVRTVIPRAHHTSVVAEFPAVGLGDRQRVCIEAIARLRSER